MFDVWPSVRDIQMFFWLTIWPLQAFVNFTGDYILFVFDVWPAGHDIRFFCSLRSFLIVSWQIYVLMTYSCSTQSNDCFHRQLHANNIVYIHSFRLEKYYFCWPVNDISIPCACVSSADTLNGIGISFLWTCGSLVYVL